MVHDEDDHVHPIKADLLIEGNSLLTFLFILLQEQSCLLGKNEWEERVEIELVGRRRTKGEETMKVILFHYTILVC